MVRIVVQRAPEASLKMIMTLTCEQVSNKSARWELASTTIRVNEVAVMAA